MSTFIRSALVALAILSSASAAMARVNEDATPKDPNSAESVQAFWENMQRYGN
jgi:hypothetical protein